MIRFIKLAGAPILFASALILVAAHGGQSQPTAGNPAEGAALYQNCIPCHGLNGKGIAGVPSARLLEEMKRYRSGSFTHPRQMEMQRVLQKFSLQEMQDLAVYISKM